MPSTLADPPRSPLHAAQTAETPIAALTPFRPIPSVLEPRCLPRLRPFGPHAGDRKAVCLSRICATSISAALSCRVRAARGHRENQGSSPTLRPSPFAPDQHAVIEASSGNTCRAIFDLGLAPSINTIFGKPAAMARVSNIGFEPVCGSAGSCDCNPA